MTLFKLSSIDFHDSNGNRVCSGSSVVSEFHINNDSTMEQLLKHPFFETGQKSGYKVYNMHDGTMIRLYNIDGVWKKATNNCKDAYEAGYENVKSFGSLFDTVAESIGFNYEELDPSYTYGYVLQHFLNRIASLNIEPKIIPIFKCCNFTNQFEYVSEIPVASDFDCINYVRQLPWDKPGISLHNNAGQILKISNPKYKAVKDLKGPMRDKTKKWILGDGIPQIFPRIVKLINEENSRIEEFCEYFNEYASSVEKVRKDIETFAGKVYMLYVSCYILKHSTLAQVPKELQNYLRKMHYQYQQSRIAWTHSATIEFIEKSPLYVLLLNLGYIVNR